jgi:hypothetical protein
MTKKIFTTLVISVALISGCAGFSTKVAVLSATNIADLEEARAEGLSRDFSYPAEEAFAKVTALLDREKIKIYLEDRKKGFIVALGFPRQTDTTRVGIFFEPLPSGGTRITLSSLSSSALERAGVMILDGLSAR